MGMLNLWNGLHPFHVVCQLPAGGIRALRAGLDLASTYLDALEIGRAYGGSFAGRVRCAARPQRSDSSSWPRLS